MNLLGLLHLKSIYYTISLATTESLLAENALHCLCMNICLFTYYYTMLTSLYLHQHCFYVYLSASAL